MKREKKTGRRLWRILAGLAAAAGVFALFWVGVTRAQTALTESGLRTTQENLRRGAITCYALEGRYPESLTYLEEHYHITVDKTRYTVYYTIFAPNLAPDITVVPN